MARGNIRNIVIIGLFIALQIIFTRLFSITLPMIRIGFGFLPLAITSIMFGPLYGAIAASIADLIGFFMFPRYTFFPGFTLTAAISGALYGVFLYKRPKTYINLILAVVSVTLSRFILNTLWLYILQGSSIFAQIPLRAFTAIVMIPIEIYMILFFWKIIISKLDIEWN